MNFTKPCTLEGYSYCSVAFGLFLVDLIKPSLPSTVDFDGVS